MTKPISTNSLSSKPRTLSIVITSYTTERLNDIYELLDSIKKQTVISQKVNSRQSSLSPSTADCRLPTADCRLPTIETIFVAERSRELYEKVREFISRQSVVNSPTTPSPNPQPLNPNPETIDCRLLTYRLLFNDGEPGLSPARNMGIKEAKGDIIAFVDDDVVLSPDWAEEMINAYQRDSVIGVTGPALPLWEDESMSWLPEELYWIISCTAWCDWNQTREVRNAWGMNMSFKREAFQKCGDFLNEFGFHKGPMAEDNEFSLRVRAKTGKNIIYCPNVRLWHRVHKYRLNQQFIKERAHWIGRSRRMLKRLYPEAEKGKDLLGQEHQLLKRIFTRLLPSILRSFFTNPTIAWCKLSVTITTLFFVALGYYSYLFSSLRGYRKTLILINKEKS